MQRIYLRVVHYSRYHLQIALSLLLLFTVLLLYRINHFLDRGARRPARPPSLRDAPDPEPEVAAARKAQKSLTVVILTCNRPRSLQRLLASLAGAVYEDDVRVNLLVRQDVPENDVPCAETRSIVWRMRWAHGTVEHVAEVEHQGAMNLWLKAFRPSHPSDYFLMLEDDMEVGRYYARWLLAALDHFRSDSSVVAVSVAKPLERGKNPLQLGPLQTSIPHGARVVKYRFHTLRGLAPLPDKWTAFLEFHDKTKRQSPGFNPTEVGEDRDAGTFRLYRELDRVGRADLAWDAWLLRFIIDSHAFVVYPWFDGGGALARSWREAGALQRRSKGPDAELLATWQRDFLYMPARGMVMLDLAGRPTRK